MLIVVKNTERIAMGRCLAVWYAMSADIKAQRLRKYRDRVIEGYGRL